MADASSAPAARKVVVFFKAIGDAPILKQSKFKIGGVEKFAKVIDFLRKQVHRETLFVYINSGFSPNPDENIWDLFEVACMALGVFQIGVVALHYLRTLAELSHFANQVTDSVNFNED